MNIKDCLISTWCCWGPLLIGILVLLFAGGASPNIPKEIARHNRQVEKEERKWAEIEKIKQARLAREKAEAEKVKEDNLKE